MQFPLEFETLALSIIPMLATLKHVYEYHEIILCPQESYDQLGSVQLHRMFGNPL